MIWNIQLDILIIEKTYDKKLIKNFDFFSACPKCAFIWCTLCTNEDLFHLQMESGWTWKEAVHARVQGRFRWVRSYGVGRSYQNQEWNRPHFDIQALMPRRHLRLLCYEHRRHQYAGLHQVVYSKKFDDFNFFFLFLIIVFMIFNCPLLIC